MKQLIALTIALFTVTAFASEKQQVCIDRIGKDGKVVVGKDGKPLQDCRMMRVHKKLEGTEVPSKK